MIEPAPHPEESRRLEALAGYAVLDTPREGEFDEVVAVLSALLDVPVALVTLLDAERQWFKAKTGIDAESTPRSISVCGHAILQREPLMVPDLQLDPRFIDNPLVTQEPHFRFYAGVPLVTPEGLPLGTLCVLDYRPRQLDAKHLRMLELMARQVMRQLEMGRLLKAEQQLRADAEALAARNALLAREVDHRVKNSLQLVTSLLALQKRASRNAEAQAVLSDAESRVRAVSAVHEQLYQAGLSETISIPAFLRSLCDAVSATRPSHVDAIRCAVEPSHLNPDQAVAVGLIVNELIANAFKHAFPDRRPGQVEVEGSRNGETYCLQVTDNGVGLPAAFDTSTGTGLGWRVLRALSERLTGVFEILPVETGAKARICFPLAA